MNEAIIIFNMASRRFQAHDAQKPIPAGSHKASLDVFRGPGAMVGARRTADAMQDTYDEDPMPWRDNARDSINSAAPIVQAVAALLMSGGVKKMPADFVED